MVAFLFAWIVACAVVFFALVLSDRRVVLQRPLAAVIVVAVVARLVPLFVFREPSGYWGIDIDNYREVAELVLAHSDVYARASSYVFIHPYLPFFMYILAASEWASSLPGLSFFTTVRLPLVAADVGTAALVFFATKELRRDVGQATNTGLAYALCPLPIVVTVYHGQFDVLPVFFAFLAWYLVYFSKPGLTWVGTAGAALGLGILAKSWPVLLLPALLFRLMTGTGRWSFANKVPAGALVSFSPQWAKRLLAFSGAAIAVPAGAVLIYLVSFQASFDALKRKNLEHRPPFQTGYADILDHLGNVLPIATDWATWAVDHEGLIMYPTLAMVAAVVVPRRGTLVAIVALLGAALMTSTGGGPHHFIWLVPFALVAGQRVFFVPFSAAVFLNQIIFGFYLGGLYVGFLDVPFGARSLDHLWFSHMIIWSILVLWVLANVAGSIWKRCYLPSVDEVQDVDLAALEAESATSRA